MQRQESVDFVIIGGGIYGLYAAHLLLKKKLKVALVECDDRIFSRASFINQARVHQGYHYPRSICTAIASARYFNRFVEDFEPAINRSFQKIYAISNRNSFTSSSQFKKFCNFCQISASSIVLAPPSNKVATKSQRKVLSKVILGSNKISIGACSSSTKKLNSAPAFLKTSNKLINI